AAESLRRTESELRRTESDCAPLSLNHALDREWPDPLRVRGALEHHRRRLHLLPLRRPPRQWHVHPRDGRLRLRGPAAAQAHPGSSTGAPEAAYVLRPRRTRHRPHLRRQRRALPAADKLCPLPACRAPYHSIRDAGCGATRGGDVHQLLHLFGLPRLLRRHAVPRAQVRLPPRGHCTGRRGWRRGAPNLHCRRLLARPRRHARQGGGRPRAPQPRLRSRLGQVWPSRPEQQVCSPTCTGPCTLNAVPAPAACPGVEIRGLPGPSPTTRVLSRSSPHL
ncbi:hypothetical protein EMIHUDRAFT_424057, partial [Emiliania huxleyi CCMP1516]|uniref:Uncharacterized protein n=2 Tax=Emiliania huxleyi TaxID=2903 RepID=A0A0D3K115_EMIH1